MKWLCCQLGAREHYAIPRALFRIGMLGSLVTDAWVPPSSLLAKCCGHTSKFRHRFHSELHDARVKTFNSSLVLFEMLAGARNSRGWPKILSRNRWFQHKVVNALTSDFRPLTSDAPVFLSYSYTALEPFRYAKSLGWKTLLVQINPGPRKKGSWQKRRRACLNWWVTGTQRHLNIGLSGARNASSPTALLLTPNGRARD